MKYSFKNSVELFRNINLQFLYGIFIPSYFIRRFIPFIFLSLVSKKVFSANSAITPSPSISLLQTILGLVVIIGLILLSAWLIRKINPNMSSSSLLRMISAISVGPREKIVIVEINDQWLIVGVTSSQVNLLQTLPKGKLPALNKVNNSSSFISKLKEAMKRND